MCANLDAYVKIQQKHTPQHQTIRSLRTSDKMKPVIAVPAVAALVYRAWSRKSLTPFGIIVAALTAVAHAIHPWSVCFVLLAVFFVSGTAVTKVTRLLPNRGCKADMLSGQTRRQVTTDPIRDWRWRRRPSNSYSSAREFVDGVGAGTASCMAIEGLAKGSGVLAAGRRCVDGGDCCVRFFRPPRPFRIVNFMTVTMLLSQLIHFPPSSVSSRNPNPASSRLHGESSRPGRMEGSRLPGS
jgi:hypothetical protein